MSFPYFQAQNLINRIKLKKYILQNHHDKNLLSNQYFIFIVHVSKIYRILEITEKVLFSVIFIKLFQGNTEENIRHITPFILNYPVYFSQSDFVPQIALCIIRKFYNPKEYTVAN